MTNNNNGNDAAADEGAVGGAIGGNSQRQFIGSIEQFEIDDDIKLYVERFGNLMNLNQIVELNIKKNYFISFIGAEKY